MYLSRGISSKRLRYTMVIMMVTMKMISNNFIINIKVPWTDGETEPSLLPISITQRHRHLDSLCIQRRSVNRKVSLRLMMSLYRHFGEERLLDRRRKRQRRQGRRHPAPLTSLSFPSRREMAWVARKRPLGG